MGPMFLLLIVSCRFLVEGIPSAEEKQTSEILKRLEAKIEKQEAKIEKQEAINFELHSKYEALRRDMSDQLKIMETKTNKTEEALKAIRETEHLTASGGKAVRDLPYIMMCAYRGAWHDTGIIPYENLTLDYSNCDRPGGGCSAMDIASGTFTAQTGGLYTVTFSGQADLKPSTALQLFLLQNGSELQESYSSSYSKSECGGTEEMFSRTVVQ